MFFPRRLFYLYRDYSWQCVTVFFVLYFAILIGGAAIFKRIEEPTEMKSIEQLRTQRSLFLSKIQNKTVTEDDVDAFAKVVLLHGSQRIIITKNQSSELNWGLGQAIFFTGTIITTLGYAQTTYLTDGGKIFSILYICIGVPFTLFFFTACVHHVNRVFLWQKAWLAFYLPKLTDLQVKLIHFFIVCIALWIALLMIPAAIFWSIEGNWSYLDAFFFCFISMSTVGMVDTLPGDAPGQSNKSLYKLSVLLYLYIGLIGVLSALRLFSDIATIEDNSSASAKTSLVSQPQVDDYRHSRLKEEQSTLEQTSQTRGYSSMTTSSTEEPTP